MAGRIALDLKQFKHLRSDKDTTTLRHRDGHELTLAHKSLSPEYQKQLSALSKISSENETAVQADEARQKYAEGPPDGLVSASEQKDSMQSSVTGKKVSPTQDYQESNVDRFKSNDPIKYEKRPAVPQKGKIKTDDPSKPLFAEGGGIEDEVSKLAPLAMMMLAEGGKPKAYAEGPQDGMVAPNDGAPQLDQMLKPELPPAPMPEAVPPILQSTRDKYNQLAGANPGDPTAPMVDPGLNTFGANGEPPKNFRSEIWQQAEQMVKSQAESEQAVKTQKVADVEAQNSVRARAGLPALPVPPAPPSAVASMEGQKVTPSQPVRSPTGNDVGGAQAAPKDQMGEGMNDAEGMMRSGYLGKLKGIEQEATAKGDLGKVQEKALDENIKAQNVASAAYKKTYDDLDTERELHLNDIREGHIDPNKYWTGWTDSANVEHGGHSKIAAGIGMILAGFNPTSNPNAAVNFLKYQMDQNLEAQKQNLNSEQNMLSANLKQFGNLRDATDMTRLMQNDIMQHELAKAAAKAQLPLAKAAALNAAGQLKMDAAPMFQNFAMRRAMIGLASNPNQDPKSVDHMLGYMRVTNPEMAKEMETRYVPGVGLASTPVPDGARQQITAAKSVNDLMNMSLQFSKQHAGTMSPSLRAQAATIQNQLIGSIKQAQHDGVYKPSEAEFLLNQIGNNPASPLAAFSSVPKIKEMQQIKQAEYNNLLSTYGLPKQALSHNAPGQEGPVKGRDGKMYIQQGNYMVPYKGK